MFRYCITVRRLWHINAHRARAWIKQAIRWHIWLLMIGFHDSMRRDSFFAMYVWAWHTETLREALYATCSFYPTRAWFPLLEVLQALARESWRFVLALGNRSNFDDLALEKVVLLDRHGHFLRKRVTSQIQLHLAAHWFDHRWLAAAFVFFLFLQWELAGRKPAVHFALVSL